MNYPSGITDLKIEDVTFCVVDVETTGLSAQNNRIIEIGLVLMKNGEVFDAFQSFINPGVRVPSVITQLTGITDDDILDAPSFDEIADEIWKKLDGCVIAGHNLQFDLGFLKYEFMRSGYEQFSPLPLCSLKLARRLYPQLKSKKLSSVAYHLRLSTDSLHRALDDASLTARILEKELALLKERGMRFLREVLLFQSASGQSLQTTFQKKEISTRLGAIPAAPGVYYFLNKENEIVYIGKAKSLSDRLKSYIAPGAARKSRKIIKNAKLLKIQPTNTELTALLLEAELIKLIDPKMNVLLKKYISKYFLRVDYSHPFPAIRVSKDIDFRGDDFFGLFLNQRKAGEILDIINRVFKNRECTDKEFTKGRGCFLAQIDRCTVPCENGDEGLYKRELQLVFDFMAGKNQSVLTRLLQQMKKYSDEQRYEKAQETKELVSHILAQVQKSALLSEPVNRAEVLLEIQEGAGSFDYILFVSGKVYIRGHFINPQRNFVTALTEYYEGVIQRDDEPDSEDLEKMKITLNWVIRNRHDVTIYYLKEYTNLTALQSVLQADLHSRTVMHPEISLREEEILMN